MIVNPVFRAAELFVAIFEVLPSSITSIVLVPLICLIILGVVKVLSH